MAQTKLFETESLHQGGVTKGWFAKRAAEGRCMAVEQYMGHALPAARAAAHA